MRAADEEVLTVPMYARPIMGPCIPVSSQERSGEHRGSCALER